ncbi:hypothetical protein CANTEDRAFT_95466 [Yamadazyma tenuis ATCC 10573]|uniref:Uncharacterized protein n=3 Tax=Candida tenuis TaxID=2315449 RepID=G3BF87_CANTC|nr:uncharacterized protein CANTEDRAFT_95466 [Yamadazyma tenuis ATCC 10573]EGV59998.1 hypothetical protein CANTEDRAFT_95466 [Yamadazyma tenuis ATCC 10573]
MSPHRGISKSKSRILSKFQEDEIFGEQEIDLDDEFKTLKLSDFQPMAKKDVRDYAEDFENAGGDLNFKLNPPSEADIKLSPGTLSSSPRRKSLSEYSEDTEVTSGFNDEEFEDIEDVFGKEEPDSSKLYDVLNSKKAKLLHDAEKEEKELIRKYRGEDLTTLKLKNLDIDLIENDKTINYEYTRDDFEDFEEGFENIHKLSFKKSMPSLKTQSSLGMRKFQSSYNLAHDRTRGIDSHPKYNNKLMSKLGRIPSFYNQRKLNEMIEENENFRLTKQQLLQQYQEIDKQHKRTNEKILNLKKSMSMPARRSKGKKIGLVRYLGEDVPNVENSKMKFNNESKNWEGNEIELMKFNSFTTKKPSLIKSNEYNNAKGPNSSNMVFDPINLKWVSKAPEEDVFKGLNELNEPDNKGRGVSNFTARTLSTNVEESDNVFIVSKKLIDRFLKEETKLARRTEYWFNKHDIYDLDAEFNPDYYWDIRKLVMDNE